MKLFIATRGLRGKAFLSGFIDLIMRPKKGRMVLDFNVEGTWARMSPKLGNESLDYEEERQIMMGCIDPFRQD